MPSDVMRDGTHLVNIVFEIKKLTKVVGSLW